MNVKPTMQISRTSKEHGMYHIECMCTNPEHALDMIVSDDYGDKVVEVYLNPPVGLMARLKTAWQMVIGKKHMVTDIVLDEEAASLLAGILLKKGE